MNPIKSLLQRILNDDTKAEKYLGFIKQSWSVTWPMLMILFFQFCMQMTDVLIAGIKGTAVQAAIGMANQVYIVLTVVITAITIGTIAVLSRIFGSPNREKELPEAVYTAVSFAAISAVLVTILALIFTPAILDMMDMSDAVRTHAKAFMKLYCIGLFCHLMMAHFNGILRACKLIIYSMKVMVAVSTLNIILSLVFCFLTPMAERGIPLATAICWIIAFIVTVPVIKTLMRSKQKLVFSKAIAKKIFNISWPSGIVSLSWQLSSTLMYAMVARLPVNSEETMAAMTAGLRIESMIFMPAFAFNMANAVLVGNLLGEDKKEDAFSVGIVTAGIGVSLITVITAVVIALASPIAAIIAAKDPSGLVNPIAFDETIKYLRIVMISEPFVAANLMFSGALAGAGDTRALMRYTLFSLWVLRIPVAYIFSIHLGYGAIAIWWAMNITFFSQSALSSRRFFSRKWMA
jgi:putative MATE family efflux protein